MQFLRAGTDYLRARCAIASLPFIAPEGAGARRREARVEEAASLGRRLEREAMPWTAPLASLVAASVANARGDRAAAATHLRAAVDRAIAADMGLFAVAADFALARLVGGEEGARLEGEAAAWMKAQAIQDPERLVSMLVPGRFGARPSSRPQARS